MQIKDEENQFSKEYFEVKDSNFLVFVGENNSGKTTILRSISKQNDSNDLINTNRTLLLGEGVRDKNYESNRATYNRQIKNADDDNVLKNVQVLQDLFLLETKERKRVVDYYNSYFPDKVTIRLENPSNNASPKILLMKGMSITKQGSGAKAILEILVKLFDSRIDWLCIDEPELGLEPKIQKVLFKALKKSGKKIAIATHSHHFLDRDDITNNYICSRNRKNKISIQQITSEIEIRNTIYLLLGNELKDFGLPEKIIIVEGISDSIYIDRLIKLLNKNEYSIFSADSDSKITRSIQSVNYFLKYIQDLCPVYRDKIWVIADSKSENDIHRRKWKQLLGNSKVAPLKYNAIEYYYPERLLQEKFNTMDNKETIVKKYLLKGSNQYNNIIVSKGELSTFVANNIRVSDLIENCDLFDFINKLD